jgi:hypothetical protein
MSKKLSLIERWEIDEAQAGMVIWRCNSCHNYRGNNGCSVYGTIPKEIAEMKKTCDEFERKPLDTE